MSDLIKNKLKIMESKKKSMTKGSKKKISPRKNKKNKNISLETSNNINNNNKRKRIIVERKVNTSISSRNKNNIILEPNVNSLNPQNEIINQRDFSSLLQKNIELGYKNYDKLYPHNYSSNTYVNNYNNNYINIKNIKIENQNENNNKIYYALDESNNNINNKKHKLIDFDSFGNFDNIDKYDNDKIHDYTLSHNNDNNNNNGSTGNKNADNSNLNNFFIDNTIIVNDFLSEEKTKDISDKNNNLNKETLDNQPRSSLSSLNSLYKYINQNCSLKDINNGNLKKIYNYNYNTIYHNNRKAKSKTKSKNKNNNLLNYPINLRNKKNNYVKINIKYDHSSFIGGNRGSRSLYSLTNLSHFSDNYDKKNNSMSFRNKKRCIAKLKGNESMPSVLNNKIKSPIVIKKNKEIKINKTNRNKKNQSKCLNMTLISKKNSASILSASSAKRKHKNKINNKVNELIMNRNNLINFIKNKRNDNSKNKIKKEKYKHLLIDKNKNNNEQNKSPFKYKNKYKEPSKEIIVSPISITSSRHSYKFIPKEYPNMALSSSKKSIPHTNYNLNKLKQNDKCIKNIIKVQSICKVGSSGPNQSIKKLNQDDYFIYKNFLNNPSYIYMGVCDGHGIFGQNISFYLKEHLPNNLMNGFIEKNIVNLSELNVNLMSEIVEYIFQKTNREMNEDERIDSSFSGSTCISSIFTPERLFCINVGDSRCVLGKYNKEKNEWIPLNLSRDHKPSDPKEKLRILNNGGRVESYMDEDGNYVGPERVWLKDEDCPGLAMSRSFGDEVAHKVGVIVCPEILDYRFNEEDKFIILASDGIWEFLSSDEVIDIIKNFYLENDLEGALDYLYKESTKRWVNKEDIIDDITMIIAFLN